MIRHSIRLEPGAYFGLERAGHRPKALHRWAQGRAGIDHPLADGPGDGDGKVVTKYDIKSMLFPRLLM